MSEALGMALSTLESMGLLVYIKAMVVVALVGGFIAVIFGRK